MSANPRTRLIDALIGIDPLRLGPLYDNDAEFHDTVYAVARVLPMILGALADDAARRANERRAAAAASAFPGMPRVVRGDIDDPSTWQEIGPGTGGGVLVIPPHLIPEGAKGSGWAQWAAE